MSHQILLIDDSKPIHALITTLLADEAVTIQSAFDGESGLLMAAKLHLDLILLDVEMPGMNGFEVCRRLKVDPATISLPIVFLTVLTASDEMVRGLELGANDYVTKPFQQVELVARVRAALRTGHLIHVLEEKALIDFLTGLGNRAMFRERYAAEMSLRIRTGHPLSCIALDVDHFKEINDKYGHPYGDLVLKEIATTVLDCCRAEDVACRQGGEEFIVLAPRTSASQAALLAERMRAAIAKIPLSRDGKSITVTASFGVAQAWDGRDLLTADRADQALYQSKEQGRNRVCVAPSPPISQAAAA